MKVMTAPLAVIQINSVTVGKMKNVRITEQIRRGRVSGLGRLNPSELPALEWSGSLSCSSYSINFNRLDPEKTRKEIDLIRSERKRLEKRLKEFPFIKKIFPSDAGIRLIPPGFALFFMLGCFMT